MNLIDSHTIQTDSISMQVYLYLKKLILSGEYAPGHRILVLEITRLYQISQAPVREALERLKQEGLVFSRPNKGSIVSDITAKEIKDIFVMREMLEGFAVRESLPFLKKSNIRALEGIIEEMDAAVRENDILKILEKDMSFHGYFYEQCGNHFVLETWNRMKTKVMRFMAISNRHYSTEKLVDVHLSLLNVLKTGDVAAIEKRFIHHMKAYKLLSLS